MSGTIGMWTHHSPSNPQLAASRAQRQPEPADEDAQWDALTRRAKAKADAEKARGRQERRDEARQRAAVSGDISHDQWAEAIRRAKQRR